MVGYLANNFLPSRAGEFVRAYLLGKRATIRQGQTLATVVLERFLELLVVFVLLATVIPLYTLPEGFENVWIIGALAGIGISGLVVVSFWGKQVVHFIVERLSFVSPPLRARIESFGFGLADGVAALRNWRMALPFFSYTALIWVLEVAGTYLVARSFDIPISPFDCLFLVLVLGVGAMIPSSPGNIGTYESAAVVALRILGFESTSALSFAIILHAVTYITINLIGLICLPLSGYTFSHVAKVVRKSEPNNGVSAQPTMSPAD